MATVITTEEEQERGYALIDKHNETALLDTPRRFYISCGALNRMFTLWSMPLNASPFATENYLGNLSTNFEKAVEKALTRIGRTYLDVDRDSLLEKRDLSRFQSGKYENRLISEVAAEDPRFIAWLGDKIINGDRRRKGLSKIQATILDYLPEAIAVLKERAAEKLRGGTYVGTVGDKIESEVVFLKQRKTENYFYGNLCTSYMHTFQDANKNIIMYSGTIDLKEKYQLEFNGTYNLSGKVKAHTEYSGILQTLILKPTIK